MVKKFLLKYRYQIFLLVIILIGTWLRFYNLPSQVWKQPSYDESRDMLVAKHIFKYRELVSRGPLAAGGLGQLKNSPVYYYLLSMLWAISPHPTSFMYLWATILTGQVLLAYFVGKQLGDKTTGIITSIVFAINSQLVFQSRQLLQTYLLPIFSLLFLWVLLKNQKKKSIINIALMIFLLLFPLHLHYGVFIIFPMGILWISYFWSKILGNKLSIENIFLPILTAVGLIISWVIATSRAKMFDQLFFFEKNFQNLSDSFFSKLHQFLLHLGKGIFPNLSLAWAILLILFFTTLAFFWLRKKRPPSGMTSWIIILSFALSTLLGGLFSGNANGDYLLSTLPFFLILLSLGLRQLISLNRLTGLIATGLMLYFLYLPTQDLLFFGTPPQSFVKQNYQIAEFIYRDNIKNNQDEKQPTNFGIVLLNTTTSLPFDGWGTSGFWFHLEELFNQRLIRLTNFGVSHSPLVIKVDDLYLICDHRELPELIDENCLNRFVDNRDYLINSPEVVYQTSNYTIWKAKTDLKKLRGVYTKVYRELL